MENLSKRWRNSNPLYFAYRLSTSKPPITAWYKNEWHPTNGCIGQANRSGALHPRSMRFGLLWQTPARRIWATIENCSQWSRVRRIILVQIPSPMARTPRRADSEVDSPKGSYSSNARGRSWADIQTSTIEFHEVNPLYFNQTKRLSFFVIF